MHSPLASPAWAPQSKSYRADVAALKLVLAMAAMELALWVFVKPLGRPVNSLVSGRTTANTFRVQEMNAVQHAFPVQDNFNILDGDSELKKCCPEGKPGLDVLCVCLPGGAVPNEPIPARPWLHSHPSEAEEKPAFDSLFKSGFWKSVDSSEDVDPAQMLHIPIAEFSRLLHQHCRQKVLAEIRNSFAEKRLNRILSYRKKIRTTTGCNPEDYDAEAGTFCGGNFTVAAKVSKGEWLRQQEEERRREQRQRQREMWRQEVQQEEDEEDELANREEGGGRGALLGEAAAQAAEARAQAAIVEADQHKHHRARSLTAVKEDMIVGINSLPARIRAEVEDPMEGLHRMKPPELSEYEVSSVSDPDKSMVEHLVKECVQREGHERMEAHRKEMERARRAKEEEQKRAAEVERYKSLLKDLEEESARNAKAAESNNHKENVQLALQKLLPATKSKDEKALLSKAAALKTKDLNAMRQKCDKLHGSYDIIAVEINNLAEMNSDINSVAKVKDMREDARKEWEGCVSALAKVERARSKLEGEADKLEKANGMTDHMLQLAKNQRKRASMLVPP